MTPDLRSLLEAERNEAAKQRDRFAVDRLSYLIGLLTTRQAEHLAANAQRALLAARLHDHTTEET